MYGYIYKTTNLINNKIYIGQHKATEFKGNLYLGSGRLFTKAVIKYGRDNFIVEMLDTAETSSELDIKEQYYISVFNSRDKKIGYNLAKGGNTGNTDCKQSQYQKDIVRNYMKNRTVSDETKKKMSDSAKLRKSNRKTINNKIWITNGINNKVVNENEVNDYLLDGYWKGITRKCTTTKEKYINSVYVNKDNKDILINKNDIQTYLNNGYILGKHKYSKSRCQNISNGKKGKICINNGISNKYIDSVELEEYLKKGFNKGYIKKIK